MRYRHPNPNSAELKQYTPYSWRSDIKKSSNSDSKTSDISSFVRLEAPSCRPLYQPLFPSSSSSSPSHRNGPTGQNANSSSGSGGGGSGRKTGSSPLAANSTPFEGAGKQGLVQGLVPPFQAIEEGSFEGSVGSDVEVDSAMQEVHHCCFVAMVLCYGAMVLWCFGVMLMLHVACCYVDVAANALWCEHVGMLWRWSPLCRRYSYIPNVCYPFVIFRHYFALHLPSLAHIYALLYSIAIYCTPLYSIAFLFTEAPLTKIKRVNNTTATQHNTIT
jgi:hypothetical protein